MLNIYVIYIIKRNESLDDWIAKENNKLNKDLKIRIKSIFIKFFLLILKIIIMNIKKN